MRAFLTTVRTRLAGRRASASSVQAPVFHGFVSYSRGADADIAERLQSGLHRFARRWSQLRALRIFRDDANLAVDPSLWRSIRDALLSSKHLILLASPSAASSEWVAREVGTWIERHGTERLLLVLTEGEIAWDALAGDFDWTRTDALPRALEGAFGDEPRYLDLRWARGEVDLSLRDPRFRASVADLAAPLHGRPKDELLSEDVRYLRRTRRLARASVAAIGTFAVLAAIGAIVAVDQRNEARRQLAIAQSNYLAAKAKAVVGEQPAQSLLLAAEALKTDDTPEARDALFTSLTQSRYLWRLVRPPRGTASAVAVSPDGEAVAAGTFSGDIYLWRWSGGPPRLLEGPDNGVSSLAFGPGSHALVSASEDGSVRRWDVKSGAMLGAVKVPRYASVAVDAGGRLLAYADGNAGRLGVLDLRSGAPANPGQESVEAPGVGDLAFADRSRMIVTTEGDALRLWDARSFRPLGRPVRVTEGDVWALASDPAGTTVVAGGQDGSVVRWDIDRDDPSQVIGAHTGQVGDVALSGDGQTIVSGGFDRVIRRWDAATGRQLGRPLRAHVNGIGDVSTTIDGRRVASVGGDGVIALWDLRREFRFMVREIRIKGVARLSAVSWRPDGRGLAIGGAAGRVALWSSRSGETTVLPRAPFDSAAGLAFSRDGRTLAVGWEAPEYGTYGELWDVRGAPRKARVQIPRNGGWFQRLRFGADGKTLVTGGGTRVAVRRLDRPSTRPWVVDARAFDVSADGRLLATASTKSDDGTVWLWDTYTRRRLGRLRTGRPGVVLDLAFGPDGRTLAAGDWLGNVVLWDAMRRRRLGEPLTGFPRPVWTVKFSPDGRTIAGEGGVTRMWQLPSRQPLGPSMPGLRLQTAAFSPDGRRLAAVAPGRASVMIWDFYPKAWSRHACAVAGRNLGSAEWEQFLANVRRYEPTCPGLPRGSAATTAVAGD